MVVVPGLTPVTNADEISMVATDVLLLVHVPPVVVFASVVPAASHTVSGPVIVPAVVATTVSTVDVNPVAVV
jgi:hypothetical protein